MYQLRAMVLYLVGESMTDNLLLDTKNVDKRNLTTFVDKSAAFVNFAGNPVTVYRSKKVNRQSARMNANHPPEKSWLNK